MVLQVGSTLNNRYRIVKLLGQGGFGAVYRAWDTTFNIPCALKENSVTSPEAQRQFEREAKLLRALRHPNLPQVMDYFILADQGQYLVMDIVEGENLEEMQLRLGRPLPQEEVVPWIAQVCNALSYLHAQNPPVIHRDIKPANIKITPDGRAMLVDFGVAKVFDPRMKTTMGARAVTPGYSPIEQYGQGTTDERTDLYALAATLYKLLTGEEPPESIQRVVRDPIIAPQLINPQVSTGVAEVILQGMDMDPAGRFQSAEHFKQSLCSAAGIEPLDSGLFQPMQAMGQAPEGTAPRASQPRPSQPPATMPSQPRPSQPRVQTMPSQPGPPQLYPQPAAPRSKRLWIWIGAAGVLLALFAVAVIVGGLVLLSRDGDTTEVTGEPTSVQLVVAQPTNTQPAAEQQTNTQPAAEQPANIQPPAPLTLAANLPAPTATDRPAPSVTPTSGLAAGATEISSIDGMVMVYIPAGEFVMGAADSDNFANDEEKPQHTVSLSAYWIDQTEVTNAMFARFAEATNFNSEREKTTTKVRGWIIRDVYGPDWAHPTGENSNIAGLDSYPVINVRWQDAAAYCRWAGKRLPTEAEWEKAARGSDGRTYPWGDNTPSQENANIANFYGKTTPAGKFSQGASPYGLLDMLGNVWEWVADFFDPAYYASSPAENPTGPAEGSAHLARGGGYNTAVGDTRVTIRQVFSTSTRALNLGFRCVKDAK